ncbi:MAG: hypothetical protein LBF89_11270 [Bacteroidales bacterium]|jgi:hypothetical protein|nr:hypothetical protein [Bacteroidales bacterium]
MNINKRHINATCRNVFRKMLALGAVCCTSLCLMAQNSTSSPFSIFGIGEIESRDFGVSTGMGNATIGLRSRNLLNHRNPAGLGGIDTLKFIFDFSGSVKFSDFTTSALHERATNFNFKNLAVGFRVTRRWTVSVGLSPYTNVGYSISKPELIEGSLDRFNVIYTGDGGVNRFYWSNSMELFKGLTAGVSASYYFGTVTHTETAPSIVISETMTANKINLDFGMQYSHLFQQHTRVTVGGVYSYKSDFKLYRSQMIANQSSGYILKEEKIPDKKMFLPESYGAGFSVWRNKNNAEWLFSADCYRQNWSVNNERLRGIVYTNSRMYNAGVQFTPNTKRPSGYMEIIRYQIGACYNESYMAINGRQMKDYSVSVGVGLPFFRGLSYVNVAAVIGQSATGYRGGIKENYALLSVNLSLIESWFKKAKYD